jgi:hypothetical protein
MTNAEPGSPPLPPSAPSPKKHGCFFYGCITSLILLLVLAVGLVLGTHYALKYVNRMVVEYTDTNPAPLPSADLSVDGMKGLLERINAFSQTLDEHSNAAPLVLTGPEVNALLANRPELAPWKGKFVVTFDGSQTKAQISLPLETFKIPMLDTKGRYLNGRGAFDVTLDNGILSVVVASLEVKGKPVSPQFLAGLQKQNLAASANGGTNGSVFDQIDSLQVTNSTLVVKAKSQ